MHPNAELGHHTAQCQRIFELLATLQPTSGHNEMQQTESGAMPLWRTEDTCAELLDEVRDVSFATEDTFRSMTDDERGPYQFILLQ